MKLYLHIGLTKTGTSAIQTFLWQYRNLLLERYNILYPETGIRIIFYIFYPETAIHNRYESGAHYYLSWSIFAPDKVKQKIKDIPNPDMVYNKLIHEIQEKKTERAILSSEFFMMLEPESIKDRLSMITKDLNIIIYLRRQDIWAEKNYSQGVKLGNLKIEFGEFLPKKSQRIEKSKFAYYNLLDHWKKVFPEAKIIPRIYDRKLFPEGNVILDFLSILGIDLPKAKEQKIEANLSLSVISTLALRKINEKFNLSTKELNKAFKFLIKLDYQEGSPIKTFFTLPERIEFLEHFRESNERLFREWFNTENQFVLSEEEIRFYEEQDKIPKEEIEKLVEDRYRKVLAYLMEENIKPTSRILGIQKPKIEYYSTDEVEFMTVDVLHVDLLKEGNVTIGGLVLLKKDIEGDYRLILKQGEVEREVKWGLSSPWLASKYPDNPKAKNARFQINGILVSKDIPLEICLEKEKIIKLNF